MVEAQFYALKGVGECYSGLTRRFQGNSYNQKCRRTRTGKFLDRGYRVALNRNALLRTFHKRESTLCFLRGYVFHSSRLAWVKASVEFENVSGNRLTMEHALPVHSGNRLLTAQEFSGD